jgi:uncharacterized Zn finger protein
MGWYYNDFDDYYEDNSTLADYKTPADAIVIHGPVRAESKRGDIGREWWGRQWVEVMERLGMGGRLDRGKRYARNGSVLSLEISHGMVYADVRGSQGRQYRTAIELRALDDKQWRKAFDSLSEQAIYAAKLLAGEMPGDIEAVFQHTGLSLFPQSKKDIDFTCSCPDWGNPCKHAAAVYYLIAEQLDADPFILFHLRGRNRDAIMQALQGYDLALPDDETEAEAYNPPLNAADFWNASAANLVRQMPVRGADPIALRQLGSPPGNIDKYLRKLYTDISQEAARWLGLE